MNAFLFSFPASILCNLCVCVCAWIHFTWLPFAIVNCVEQSISYQPTSAHGRTSAQCFCMNFLSFAIRKNNNAHTTSVDLVVVAKLWEGESPLWLRRSEYRANRSHCNDRTNVVLDGLGRIRLHRTRCKRWSEEGKRKDFRFRSMINQHTTIWRNTKRIEKHAQHVVGKYVAWRRLWLPLHWHGHANKSCGNEIVAWNYFISSWIWRVRLFTACNNTANSHERFTNCSAVCCILLFAPSIGLPALPVYSILKHESDINYHRHET